MFKELASYRRCVKRIYSTWPGFTEKRQARLVQQDRHGVAAEKVAENIIEDLFTEVLDWPISDLNNQVEYADLLLTSLGIKYLLIEIKRPGALAWHRKAVEAALNQAVRYAGEQKVQCVAVSDGYMLYAADMIHGGLKDRVVVRLDAPESPDDLWWLSVHGIYRERNDIGCHGALGLLPDAPTSQESEIALPDSGALLHPKYKLPAECFGYVGHPGKPATWKLPYCNSDGAPDTKRLPKAIQAILSNYRGVKISGIPEQAIPDVLVRLALAAVQAGKMPHQTGDPAPVYQQLAAVLEQLGRIDEVISPSARKEKSII
ncbi:MAG: hypothetical protein ABSA04_07830 [Desulfobaccales bacterium]|jgi:hypothetical protein